MPPAAEPLGAGPVTWRSAALRLGEELASTGPEGYYEFTPEQWLQWALRQREAAALFERYRTSEHLRRLRDQQDAIAPRIQKTYDDPSDR